MEVIFKTIVGSTLYNLHSESSDVDYKGIFMPERERAFPHEESILGLRPFSEHKREETVVGSDSDKEEAVLYSGRYFIQLYLKGNPTLAEIPFVDPKFVVESTDLGWKIINFVKENMITRHLFGGYIGYFSSQIRGIKDGKGKHREKRLDDRARDMKDGHYDQKMLSHAYRIGVQGVELFSTGKMSPTMTGEPLKIARAIKFEGPKAVSRKDAIDLLVGLENDLLEAKKNSPLPYEPDFNKVHQFTMSFMKEYYNV